jgi:hypothetical protein
VYRALLDPEAVQRWMVPEGMTSHVHSFDTREGGAFRISLTYDTPTTAGKTSARTDTFNGPPGVSPADNHLGWSMSIDKLTALVQSR